MKIDYPVPAQGMALAALWQEAFGDSLEAIEGFFCTGFSPSRCRCVTVGGEIVAGLYWLDAQFQGRRYAYLYAVATKESHRGQGLFHQLMADTHQHLGQRSYAAVLLVPQREDLRGLYRSLGYRDCTACQEFTCAAGDAPAKLHRIDRDTYAAARRAMLPQGSVLQEGENIAYLETMAFFYQGANFLVAARQEGQTLYCPELLGDASAAPGIVNALRCASGIFRTPGEGRAFAMFLPLQEDAPQPSYLGFAFD